MSLISPESNLSKYIDLNGNYSEEGKKRLIEDSKAYYRTFELNKGADYDAHNALIDAINEKISNKSPSDYSDITGIITSDEYVRLSGYFNDLNEFKSIYAIYITESLAHVSPSILDIIENITDYISLRHTALYCFRRIQILCDSEDIGALFSLLINRSVSIFFIIQTLKEAKVGNKGYISHTLSSLYHQYKMNTEASIIFNYANSTYTDMESSFTCEPKQSLAASHKKISFISCVNDQNMYSECLYYINRLFFPEGTTVDTIAVTEAESMTSGYNAAMHSSDADIKVYLHQDVCIINPYFIVNLISLFDQNPNLGVIGMVGSPVLPPDAVMWHGKRIGNLYNESSNLKYTIENHETKLAFEYVEAADGLLLATSKDIEWREDLFSGWDFYDASICAEFRKQGFQIAVPHQPSPWVIHDDGIMNLYSYGKYRDIYANEYLR